MLQLWGNDLFKYQQKCHSIDKRSECFLGVGDIQGSGAYRQSKRL